MHSRAMSRIDELPRPPICHAKFAKCRAQRVILMSHKGPVEFVLTVNRSSLLSFRIRGARPLDGGG